MDITVLISVTREEIEEFRRDYEEWNNERITDKEILASFIGDFYGSASEYIYDAKVQAEIAE